MTSICVFMVTLDSSIVSITLPTISNGFHVPLNGSVEWVTIGYLVINAAMLLPCGRLSDLIGRLPLFLSGLILFTLASACCGLAPTLDILIFARVLQGLGGAMMTATSMALLSSAFPDGEQGRVLGWNTVIIGIGTSAGPTLGSIIDTLINWHWIFFVNIPVGLVGILLAVRISRWHPPMRRHARERFDGGGTVCLALAISGMMVYLSFGQEMGWSSPLLLCAFMSLLMLCILPWIERRLSAPLIDLALLRNRVFLLSSMSLLFCYASLITVSFLLPFYCVQSRTDSPLLTGGVLAVFPLTLALVSPLSGRFADAIGVRLLTTIGLALVMFGLLSLSFLNTQSSLFDLVWRLMLTGVGQALFLAPNNATLMTSVARHQRGSASGFLATSRTVGQSLGIALSGAIFDHFGGGTAGRLLETVSQAQPQFLSLEAIFTQAFHWTFLVCANLAMIGLVLCSFRGRAMPPQPFVPRRSLEEPL